MNLICSYQGISKIKEIQHFSIFLAHYMAASSSPAVIMFGFYCLVAANGGQYGDIWLGSSASKAMNYEVPCYYCCAGRPFCRVSFCLVSWFEADLIFVSKEEIKANRFDSKKHLFCLLYILRNWEKDC